MSHAHQSPARALGSCPRELGSARHTSARHTSARHTSAIAEGVFEHELEGLATRRARRHLGQPLLRQRAVDEGADVAAREAEWLESERQAHLIHQIDEALRQQRARVLACG